MDFAWLFIAVVLAFLLLFLLFKAKKLKTMVAYLFIFIGIAFIVFSVFYIYSGQKIDFTSLDGVASAIRVYVSWLVGLGKNIGKIGGYAIKQNWGANATINATG